MIISTVIFDRSMQSRVGVGKHWQGIMNVSLHLVSVNINILTTIFQMLCTNLRHFFGTKHTKKLIRK